ncbi:MAG: carbohydrate-binding domain-containing protein [Alloprevotella sp.]
MRNIMIKILAPLLLAACSLTAAAQDVLRIHRTDGVTLLTGLTSTDSLKFSSDGSKLRVYLGQTIGTVALADIDSLTFGPQKREITVRYGEKVAVTNPYAFQGVEISIDANGRVTANATADTELTYLLTGSGTGAFKLYSVKKQTLVLDNLSLTSPDGPALNIQSKKKTTLNLPEGSVSSLTDAAAYTSDGTEDMKGAIFSEGQIVITGTGTLNVSGLYKHAVCSDDYISLEGGTLNVLRAASDGVHANDYYTQTGGTLTITNTGGDGIESEGTLLISGGTVDATIGTADTKAVKSDSTMTIAGGTLTIKLNADQTKGLKSKCALHIDGGTLSFNCTGGVTVVDGEPSYCTAIKCDSILYVTGGDISITHSGASGKGLSADLDLNITGGTVTGAFSGNGQTYTNASGTSDTCNATGIKADGALNLLGGTIDLSCSGTGGKGISADGLLTIGTTESAPQITVKTTGSKISGSTSGGSTGGWPNWGGGGPGGGKPGGSTSGTGGNPKAIRCESNVHVVNGHLILSTSADGGEGLESKQTLTIDGGTIEATTYDDALNAATAIVINGGNVYCSASGNDGIDSNGTITINGGQVLSCGATSPEEGFDCDQNTFLINGGVLVGLGGSTSTPSSSSAQCAAVYSGASGSQGTVYSVCASDGSHVLSVTIPRQYSSMTMLLSSPLISQGGTYSIKSGATLTGGDNFNGLATGGTLTGGVTAKTFTASSKVTTIR